jgi:CheY-like chemotaxis protein
MPIRVAVLLGAVAAVGWVDFLTGFEVSVSFLYLLPIALGTRVAGRSVGNLVALASAGAWLGADLLAGHAYGHWLIPLWDALMFAGTLLVVVALLASLREANEGLKQTVAVRTQALQTDNNQRRQAEEELRRALSDVRRTQVELQQTQFQLIETAKMESAARLAAGIAHEVKNPLMTLSLGVDYFLNRKCENPDETQLTQDMKEAVHRASDVINVLLDYGRPRPLHRTQEDIHNVIENSLTLGTKRILIVDDEPGVTRSLKTTLEAAGDYEVLGENNAANALNAARLFQPDIILLDVIMPSMDGGDVAAQLRADPLLRDIPVIFLTALVSNEETHGHEMLKGAQTFLAKPADLGELKRTLEEHIRR